tara:strand:- start:2141 stop:3427 length:1287 start_codon:yes stop_codon:yes gene_type:complete
MSDTNTNTTIDQKNISPDELDNLLGMPGADSVTIPAEEEKPSFFTKDEVDVSFLNEPIENTSNDVIENNLEKTTEEVLKPEVNNVEESKNENFDDLVAQVDDVLNEEDDSNVGRPKLDKEGMAQLTKELIKEGLVVPFENEEEFKDYSLNDYKDLIKANFDSKAEELHNTLPKQFKDNLPPELQYAADYVFNGGEDLKGLFKYLSKAEEVKQYTLDTENGQNAIAREYLRATNFGNDEDIQEQIEEWVDLGKLESKAGKFKPKLDKMQEQIVQRQVDVQKEKKQQQEEQSHHYMNSVYDTLKDGKLGDVKLNSKIQNLLYAGLVQPNYPSISGKSTNLFGHLIEKYQFVEPNHGLIAEALWLLADPSGYKSNIKKSANTEQIAQTVRKLKTEQSTRNPSTVVNETSNDTRKRDFKAIKKPTKDFFKRN